MDAPAAVTVAGDDGFDVAEVLLHEGYTPIECAELGVSDCAA